MTPLASHPGGRSIGLTPSDVPPVVRRTALRYPTTALERLLLMAAIVLLPLEQRIPTVAGVGGLFIIFGVLAGYILLNRPRALAGTWLHPVFLAAYTLLAVSALMEFAHPLSDYSDIFRVGEMVTGAVFVASLCRDRRALRAGLYGYLVAGVWLSLLLFLTIYGVLRGARASDFDQASQIREAFMDNPLEANLNTMAFLAAQGATVALALALATRSFPRRNLFLGTALLCAVAAFLPMSRSGIIIVGVSCATVLFAYGVNVRTLGVAVVLGACVLIWTPEAAWSRFTFSTHAREVGKEEGRARIYTAAVKYLPEYGMTGVGAGTFNAWWGFRHGWYNRLHTVTGAHNCFIQVTIFWGLPGLLALLAVVYQAARCLPKRCSADVLGLCLLGIAVSLLFLALVTHRLHGKEFSLGLGLLVGARRWIWPEGIVPVVSRKQWHYRPVMKPARRATAS